MRPIATTLFYLVYLAGCSDVLTANVRDKMTDSLAAYQACLAAHPSDPPACQVARQTYETDRQAYSRIFNPPVDLAGGGGGGGGM
jgi:hypothetical protein